MNVRKNISTIEYANARIRGHRARLFDAALYEDLLNTHTLDEVINILDATKYRASLSKELLFHSGALAVGYAAAEYLSEEYRFCAKFYTYQQERSIDVLAADFDVQDFKTVIRGKFAGASYDDIVEHFAGSGLYISRAQLRSLARQKTLEDVVSTALALNIPFAIELKVGAEQYAISEALIDFDMSLDQAYFAWARKQTDHMSPMTSPIRAYVIGRIDAQNIMTLARIATTYEATVPVRDVERFYIPGGSVFSTLKEFLKASEVHGIEALSQRIKNPRFSRIIMQQSAEYHLSGSLVSLDHALLQHIRSAAISVGKMQIDQVGVCVAYLLALENEVTNVRLIAHAKAFNVENDDIKKELIGV